MDLISYVGILLAVNIVIIITNIFLIAYLKRKLGDINLLDKTIFIPIMVIIVTLSLIFTSTSENVNTRFDFCFIAGIIEFIIHCVFQVKKYKGIIGAVVAYVQGNVVFLTAMVITLGTIVIGCLY